MILYETWKITLQRNLSRMFAVKNLGSSLNKNWCTDLWNNIPQDASCQVIAFVDDNYKIKNRTREDVQGKRGNCQAIQTYYK